MILIIGVYPAHSQAPAILNTESYERGIYATFEEFKENKPSMLLEFDLKPGRAKRYDLNFEDSVITKKQLKEIWGFSTGDSVYVNARNYQLANGFVPLLAIGRYCYFQDQVSSNSKSVSNGAVAGIVGGMIGGAIGSINSRTPLILNLNNGKFFYATQDVIELILESERGLVEQYRADKERNTIETKFQYLDTYNVRNKNEINGVGIEDGKVIFYRRDKKQTNDSLTVRVNGVTIGKLAINSMIESEVLNPSSTEICVNDYCSDLSFSSREYNYVECSMTTTEKTLKIVDKKVGEFYFNKFNYSKENTNR